MANEQKRPQYISRDKAVAGFVKWLDAQNAAQTCGPRPLSTSFDRGALVKFEVMEPKRIA